jgi:hypothetical protein
MTGLCIYCGEGDATERDHIPPKCFFPSPKPASLITVPSCEKCNRQFGKDDERARNILTALDVTERHKAVERDLAERRNRSLSRTEGLSNLRHVLNSMKIVDVVSKGGVYLKSAMAFNLDQPVMDRFMTRMSRALLHHENRIGYVDCSVEWQLLNRASDLVLPSELLSVGKYRSVGDVFAYIGFYFPGQPNSLWILSFFGGFEVLTFLKAHVEK